MTRFAERLERFDTALPSKAHVGESASNQSGDIGAIRVIPAPVPQPDPDEDARARAEERAAAEVQARIASLEAMTAALTRAVADAETHSSADRAARAKAFAQALATLLPTILGRYRCDEIAAGCARLLERRGTAGAALHMAVTADDTMVDTMSTRFAPLGIEIVLDPGVPAHQVSLHWRDGGADFDPASLIQLACDAIDQTLSKDQRSQSIDV